MKIQSITYANSVLPESMVFQNGDPDRVLPITFTVYLIQTENRNILVDAGCETMPGFVMKNFCGPIRALNDIGLSPDDITDVVITHAHHDHIECVKYFSKAMIYIQKDEFEKGKKYIPNTFYVQTFDDEIQIAPKVRVIRIGGHSKGSCVVHISHGDREYVIVGDECYKRACIEQGIPTGNTCCLEKSKQFLCTYSRPKYTLLYCHDA